MNILVIFTALLLAIIVFFLLYCLQYKKLNSNKNKVIEKFQSQGNCASEQENIFYIEIDNEQQACFNYIDELYSSSLVGNEFTLYNFDGEKSYAYVRDFLDNYFNISLVVIFRDVTKNAAQTLIQTKYLLLELVGNVLEVTYNYNGENSTKKTFSNIAKDQRYQLNIEQNFDYRDIYVIFDKYEEYDEDNLNNHIFDAVPIHTCKYSSGNDIFIGCNREKTNYLKAYIGDITFNFDKTEFDKYDMDEDTPLPADLECDPDEYVPLPTLPPPTPTTQYVAPFDNLENYISIDFGNQLNDLKIKYYDSSIEDKLNSLTQSSRTEIINFFNRTKLKQKIFSNAQYILIEKNDGFFDGYDNLRNHEDENMYYLFSLNNEKNINILSKFSFLDLQKIKEYYDLYRHVHIFIYGEKANNKSFFKFLSIKKPAFFIVFKNDDDNVYQFEQININLRNLNNIYKGYLEFLSIKIPSENNINNYLDYINSLQTYNSLSSEQTMSEDIEELEYSKNIFRIYDSRIDFKSITVSIFENFKLKDLVNVKYKDKFVKDECNFVPRGETKFECIQLCNNDEHYKCKETQCTSLCNNCQNSNCKWNTVNIERQKLFVPTSIRIKGFSGDGKIKLTWIKPMSNYKIDNYYIISENEVNQSRFDMYTYDGEEEMVEFIISNLENNLPYSFYVFSKNSQGVSDPSNKVTLIPQKNKLLDMENVSKNTYSDSLQNYYKTLDSSSEIETVNKQIRNMDYLIETNRLKEILVDKIVSSKINNLNVNVY